MPTSNANIAVVIPVYNVTQFLEEAIASVVTQNYAQHEIIVVDDGSFPAPAAEIMRICEKHANITLLKQPHTGVAAARNHGVAHTSATFILFLDADDILLPGALAYLVECLEQNPNAVASYGRMNNIDAQGNIIDQPRPDIDHLVSGRTLLFLLLEKSFLLYNGMVCIRRQALEMLHPDNQHLTLGEDWVLWCHLALSGEIIPAGERIVMHYRRHDSNVTSTLLDDPSTIFASIATVFSSPSVIESIGANEVIALQEKCVGRMHAFLARGYAKRLQWDKAQEHLTKGSTYIKTLNDNSDSPNVA